MTTNRRGEDRAVMVELLALAVQLPAVRTQTNPQQAAGAAMAAARVWYNELESKKSSADPQPSGQTGKGKSRPRKK